jgi:GNAT superfamily N-acetyltransferase
MNILEFKRDDFIISTDASRLDVDCIHKYLSEESYWAKGRPLSVVQRTIEHSLCFGVYQGEQQVGFARVVTDYGTFAWIADVFILPSHRGYGLGKWLIDCIVTHPELQGMRRFLLATRDAHDLYRTYGGFQPLRAPERFMERVNLAMVPDERMDQSREIKKSIDRITENESLTDGLEDDDADWLIHWAVDQLPTLFNGVIDEQMAGSKLYDLMVVMQKINQITANRQSKSAEDLVEDLRTLLEKYQRVFGSLQPVGADEINKLVQRITSASARDTLQALVGWPRGSAPETRTDQADGS